MTTAGVGCCKGQAPLCVRHSRVRNRQGEREREGERMKERKEERKGEEIKEREKERNPIPSHTVGTC